MKKVLPILSLCALLSSCGTLRGSMDLSYLPIKYDDKKLEHITKQEFDMYYSIPINSKELQIGGIQRTYTDIKSFTLDFPYFTPIRQEYEIYGKYLINDNLNIYVRHICSHPVNDTEFWLWKDDVPYIINHDSETEFGVKIKF